jgi:hypothetical protein
MLSKEWMSTKIIRHSQEYKYYFLALQRIKEGDEAEDCRNLTCWLLVIL